MNHPDPNRLKKLDIEEYEELVKRVKPKPAYVKNLFWAFVVGGLICSLAQWIMNWLIAQGISLTDAGAATSCIMIFLAALFTGLGVYDQLAKFAGAGSIVPITGFANAIVASALEFKREGYVFGVGSRMFNVAGPTLVFGFVVAVLVGLLKVYFNS